MGKRCQGRRGFDRVAAIVVTAAIVTATADAVSLISVRDEIAIGRQAQRQVRQQVPEYRDATARVYISDIGRRLAAAARGPRYPYSFSIADRKEINAFALPGGPVWINRGAIAAARNESQLAGVIAHEIAHISERHAADQLTKAIGANLALGLLGALLGSGTGSQTTQVAARLLANGVFLKFSRDDEREADRIGAQIMHRAGWDARGLTEFMRNLAARQGHDPGSVATFFSSHPSPQGRVELLRQTTARMRGGVRDSARFRSVRRRVARQAQAASP